MPPDPDDHQRSRLYEAENAVFKQEQLVTLSELQGKANEIIACGWWTQRYKQRKWKVKDGRGQREAQACHDRVSGLFPKSTRYPSVLVHEMAHTVDPTGTEDHGAVFAALLLFCIGHVYSPNAKRRLTASYRKHGVVWDRKIARTGKP